MSKDNFKKNRKNTKKVLKGGDSTNQDRFAHIQAVQARPLEVRVHNNLDKALRAFRALVQKERILSLYKEKQTYEKPSDRKRRKRNEYIRNMYDRDRRPSERERDRHPPMRNSD
jgi:ribosomal protein S21